MWSNRCVSFWMYFHSQFFSRVSLLSLLPFIKVDLRLSFRSPVYFIMQILSALASLSFCEIDVKFDRTWPPTFLAEYYYSNILCRPSKLPRSSSDSLELISTERSSWQFSFSSEQKKNTSLSRLVKRYDMRSFMFLRSLMSLNGCGSGTMKEWLRWNPLAFSYYQNDIRPIVSLVSLGGRPLSCSSIFSCFRLTSYSFNLS
mgnify:CR=1 FL=1